VALQTIRSRARRLRSRGWRPVQEW
jgi:hypothetical protein